MRISDRSPLFAVACAALVCGGPAVALDANSQPEGRATPIESFSSVTDALRAGVKGLTDGDKPSAVRALQFAASKGSIAAQWKLGRMYADGDGVPQDDYKAFQFFSSIANNNPEEARGTVKSGVVAKAFVHLGNYFLEGIARSPIRPNPARAHEMFHYAASMFGDADAQFSLGRLYLDGTSGRRDPRQAARWLNLAAEKGHAPAQAVLGQMLFNGQDGIPRQRPLGLSWMYIARQGADQARDGWIAEMTQNAEAGCSDDERKLAAAYARRASRPASPMATAPNALVERERSAAPVD